VEPVVTEAGAVIVAFGFGFTFTVVTAEAALLQVLIADGQLDVAEERLSTPNSAVSADDRATLRLTLAKARGRLQKQAEAQMLEALRQLPSALAAALRAEPEMAAWAAKFARCEHALFLGRGVHFPIALEGALKLKEISYIHAEAYAAGELKHGPLALVDRSMPVIAIAPRDALLDKLKSNLQEVRARGGELYVLANHDASFGEGDGIHVVRMHDAPGVLSPIVTTVPLQLLAYHAALLRGNDVDKPRNLAKSVTVE